MFHLDFYYNLVWAETNQLAKPEDSVILYVITFINTVSLNKQ